MPNFLGFHNAFFHLDTYGLPLGIQIDLAEKHGPVMRGNVRLADGVRIALDSFVYDAVAAGWKFDKAISLCEEALAERYGTSAAAAHVGRLASGCKAFIAGGGLDRWRRRG